MAIVGETGQYSGEYSIKVRTKAGKAGWGSWNDICNTWHLVPEGQPMVNPPPLKSQMLNLPGTDGFIDLTEAITGFPLYGARTGSMSFFVLNDWFTWPEVYSKILNEIHGKEVQVILNDDPEWYYNGRITVNNPESDKGRNKITLDYTFDPYKLCLWESISDDWLWDPFSFEDGIITSGLTKDIQVTNSKTIDLPGNAIGRRPVSPIFRVAEGSEFTRIRLYNPELNGSAYVQKTTINVGDNHWMDMIISAYNSANQCRIQIYGTGTISIVYRAGKL